MDTAHAASYASICAHYLPLRLSSQRNLLLYRAMEEPRWASGQFTALGNVARFATTPPAPPRPGHASAVARMRISLKCGLCSPQPRRLHLEPAK